MTQTLAQLNGDLADVVDQVRRSLVQVSAGVGNGAGTLWHSDGLIVTNAHVVGGVEHGRPGRWRGDPVRDGLSVTLPDGTAVPAHVLAQDPEQDLAALSVDLHDLPTIEPGDSRRLKPGHWVFAIGHPWGVRGAASAGVVIGMGADWPDVPSSVREWVVTSLKVRPGNSGGPLVDSKGR